MTEMEDLEIYAITQQIGLIEIEPRSDNELNGQVTYCDICYNCGLSLSNCICGHYGTNMEGDRCSVDFLINENCADDVDMEVDNHCVNCCLMCPDCVWGGRNSPSAVEVELPHNA